jgi:branched-chain amino acid transport system substrate-binding protein
LRRMETRMRIPSRFILTWALMGVLLAVPLGSMRAVAAEPYELNVILSLTGTAAFLGHEEQQSLGLLERLVNRTGGIGGRPIHLNVADDQSNPQVAVQLATALIAKNVPVILGPSVTATCNAIAPLVRDRGPVDYCFSPGIHPTLGSYVFAAAVPAVTYARVILHYMRQRGLTRFAILATTDGSGQEGEHSIGDALAEPENRSIVRVALEHFNPADISVAAQIARIKEANPQGLYVTAAGTPFGTVLHAVSDAGLDTLIFSGANNMSTPQMIQYANFAVQKIYIPGPLFFGVDVARAGPVKRAQETFFAEHRAIGVQPDNPSSLGWDPTLIVVNALRTVGTGATSTQVRDAIEHTHGFFGIDGVYDFDNGNNPWGLTDKSVIMTHWDPVKQSWVPVSKAGGE